MDLYRRYNPGCLTILHWPTFCRNVAAGLHHLDHSFGDLVLMVCALASRVSTDPRVLVDGVSWHSAGWKYYAQTSVTKCSPFSCPNLYDVQACCVSHSDVLSYDYIRADALQHAAIYLLGSSSPQSGWPIIGLGLRYAIELGYHRHIPGKATVDSELRKRAFWAMFFIDRHSSLYAGRPFGIRDEE